MNQTLAERIATLKQQVRDLNRLAFQYEEQDRILTADTYFARADALQACIQKLEEQQG